MNGADTLVHSAYDTASTTYTKSPSRDSPTAPRAVGANPVNAPRVELLRQASEVVALAVPFLHLLRQRRGHARRTIGIRVPEPNLGPG